MLGWATIASIYVSMIPPSDKPIEPLPPPTIWDKIGIGIYYLMGVIPYLCGLGFCYLVWKILNLYLKIRGV